MYCDDPKTWNEAEEACKKEFDGTLAVDNTSDTHLILTDLIKNVNTPDSTEVWIGGHTRPREWHWLYDSNGKCLDNSTGCIILMVSV